MIEHPTPDATITDRIAALLARLQGTGPLRRDDVVIPGTTTTVAVTRPSDIDALLDLASGDPEQNLPYWAELWPSGIALAAAIVQSPYLVRNLPVLELGSGIGITAAIAIAAGADLTTTDYAPESLILTRVTCLRHTGREPRTLRINWRESSNALLADVAGGFPVVLAADVLYERRDVEPLLGVVGNVVAPGGMLWLAEPGRAPAAMFLDEAARRGWLSSTEEWRGPWPDPDDDGVVVRIHRLRRGSSHGPS